MSERASFDCDRFVGRFISLPDQFPRPVRVITIDPFSDEDLIVTQTLDVSRQRDARHQAALLAVDGAEAEVGVAAQELARDVGLAYVAAQAAAAEADLAREAEERLRRLEGAVQVRVTRGAAPRTAAVRAEVEALRASQASQLAASRRAVALARLRALVGWGADGDPRLDAAIATGTLGAERAGLLAEALARRPELVALRARAAAQEYEVQAIGRSRFPDLLLAGRRARVLAPQADVGVRAGLQFPLWDFGAIGGAEQEAEAILAERRAQVRAEEARIQGEGEAGLARLRGARLALLAYQPRVLERSRELARKVEVGYRAGVYALFELLDAHEALRLARLAQLQATLEAAQAEIELAWAVGLRPAATATAPAAAGEPK